MRTRANALALMMGVAVAAALLVMSDRLPRSILVALVAGAGCALMPGLVRRRPAAAFGLLVLLASLSGFYVRVPVGQIRVEQLPMLVAVVTILATRAWPGRAALRPVLPIIAALALYLAVLSLSSVVSALDLKISLRMIAWTGLSLAAGAAAFSLLLREDAGRSDWFTPAGVLQAGIGVLVGVLYLLFGPDNIPGMQISPFEVPKVAALGFEANLYASGLGALLPFVVDRYRRRRDRRSGAVVILVVVGIGLGVTRAVYLGASLGVLASLGLLAWRKVPTGKLGRLVPVLLTGLLLAPAVSAILLPRTDRAGLLAGLVPDIPVAIPTNPDAPTPFPTVAPDDSWTANTLKYRIVHSAPAVSEFIGSPVIGLGAATFGQRHVLTGWNAGMPDYLGIMALNVLYESGLLGAAALGIAILLGLRLLYRASGVDPGAVAPFVGSVVVLLVAYQSTNGIFQALFWVILGGGVGTAVRLAPGAVTASRAPAPLVVEQPAPAS